MRQFIDRMILWNFAGIAGVLKQNNYLKYGMNGASQIDQKPNQLCGFMIQQRLYRVFP